MELYGNRQTPMTGIGRESLIIREPSSFTASSGTKCKLRVPRNFTSTQSEILKTAVPWQGSPRTSSCVHSSLGESDLSSRKMSYGSLLSRLLRRIHEKCFAA